jgi:hypothetical protein
MMEERLGRRRCWLWTLALLGLVALLVGIVGALSASAEEAGTVTVTNTNDGGPGSLRQAIADAQPGDTVEFALGTPATIVLTSGELVITKPLTIAGPGPELLAVSGNDASRVFRVDKAGGSEQIEVTISGLTIRDGDAGASYGGGLWNDEDLSLTNVRFDHNEAGCDGGGMYSEGSGPALTHVTFVHNRANAGYGSGMYNWGGSPILTHVTFESNSRGGMYNWGGSPTLTDVRFEGNSGVGMYNEDSSSPALTSVTFGGNLSRGMYNGYYSDPVLADVTFYGNLGGGMSNYYHSNPTLVNVVFSGNSTGGDGGGMYNAYYSSPALTNVVLSGNRAGGDGGGMYNDSWSSPTLTNVSVNGNLANGSGGGMYNYGASSPRIQNSLVWGNSAVSAGDQISNEWSRPLITYSDIQGSGGSGAGWDPNLGFDLGGNIDVDPLFRVPVGPATAPTTAGNLRLWPRSPVVNAGDSSLVPPGVTTDVDGEPRIAFGTVDMGAYELQPLCRIHVPLVLHWTTVH